MEEIKEITVSVTMINFAFKFLHSAQVASLATPIQSSNYHIRDVQN